MSLRDLDERVVPQAARRLRGGVEVVRGAVRAGRRRLERLSDPLPADAVPGPLRRLDERLVDRGPLQVLARAPQYAALVLAALLLVGTSLAITAPEDLAGESAVQVAGSAPGTLGPAVGVVVDDYLAQARAAAVEASRERPDVEHLALVSLSEYALPGQIAPLVEGLQPLRAYLRVPGTQPTEVLSVEVAALEGDLSAVYAATADRKAEDAAELRVLAESIGQDPAQQQFQQFYRDAADVAARESEAYRTGCACLFAVVVRGPAALLASLPALSGVRGVELAAPGTELVELRVQPLAPEQTGTVEPAADPRPQVPGTVPGS